MLKILYASRSDAGYTKVSAGVIAVPTITNNNDGTLTLGDGTYMLFSGPNYTLPLVPYVLKTATYSFTDNTTNYIVADYNSNSPILRVTTDRSEITQSDIIEVLNVFRSGTRLEYSTFTSDPSNGLANRISDMVGRVYGYLIEPGGFTIGEKATRQITLTGGYVWEGGSNRKSLSSYDSTTDDLYLYYHLNGVWTTQKITAYVNNQYDDGTNLQPLSLLHYATNWVFKHTMSTKTFIVLGNNDFLFSSAQASKIPANLPSEILAQCFLVGRIIVGRNDNVAKEITSAFETDYKSSSVSDHESLSNLYGGDTNDHWHLTETQHALATQWADGDTGGLLSSEDWLKFDASLRTDQTSPQDTLGTFHFQDISLLASGTVTRDANGYIQTVVKPTRTITITRDLNGFIQSFTDGRNTWTVSRDANNYITGWTVT